MVHIYQTYAPKLRFGGVFHILDLYYKIAIFKLELWKCVSYYKIANFKLELRKYILYSKFILQKNYGNIFRILEI